MKAIYYIFNHTKNETICHGGHFLKEKDKFRESWTEKEILDAIESGELFMFNENDEVVVHCYAGHRGVLDGLRFYKDLDN